MKSHSFFVNNLYIKLVRAPIVPQTTFDKYRRSNQVDLRKLAGKRLIINATYILILALQF